MTPGSNQSTFAPVEGERESVVLVSRQGGRVGQDLGNEVANQYLRNEGTALALQTAKSTRSWLDDHVKWRSHVSNRRHKIWCPQLVLATCEIWTNINLIRGANSRYTGEPEAIPWSLVKKCQRVSRWPRKSSKLTAKEKLLCIVRIMLYFGCMSLLQPFRTFASHFRWQKLNVLWCPDFLLCRMVRHQAAPSFWIFRIL